VRRKRIKKEKNYTFIFLVVLIVFFLAFANVKAFLQNKKIKQQLEDSVKKLEMLKTQKERLEKELERGKKESFWEEKAREQGYQKEGEEPMIIKIK
jgi:cell division protein FtsB